MEKSLVSRIITEDVTGIGKMEIIINHRGEKWDKIKLNFDSKVPVNTGTFHSLGELVTLKDIEKEVRNYLNITDRNTSVMPSVHQTEVYIYNDAEYLRIKTIVKRDNIIENILNSSF
jgi:hypothetical protein